MSRFEGLPEIRRKGLEKMEQVYGFEMTDGEGDFFRYTADHLFGEVWNRPGLSDRDRRLLLIGLLAGKGYADVLGIQVPAALANDELDARALREIAVATPPGWMTVTPTPVPSNSCRSDSLKPRTANLDAAYAVCSAGAMMPNRLDTFATCPPLAVSAGRNAFVSPISPNTLISKSHRISSIVSSSKRPASATPAALTRTVTRP